MYSMYIDADKLCIQKVSPRQKRASTSTTSTSTTLTSISTSTSNTYRRALGDRRHVEIQKHRAPQREACLYSHPMPLRNRSAQVDGPCAATERGVSGDTSANSYYRRCIAIDANAAVRSHGHYIQNRKSTHGWHRNANRRCSAGGRKQDGGKH